MCESVGCTFLGQWKDLAEFLYFLSGVLLLAGVGLAYLTYRSARQSASYRNTIDKFASYRNAWDLEHIYHVNELIENGSFAGSEYTSWTLTSKNYRSACFVLNEWEEIALCVKYKIYSEQLVFEYYGHIGLGFWKSLRPFIRHEQKTRPTKWSEFDRLAVSWMIRTTSKLQSDALKELKDLAPKLDAVLLKLSR